MLLRTTLDSSIRATWSDAVLRGLAADGGLYLPTELPSLAQHDLTELATLPFPELAFQVARRFLGDEVSDGDLRAICESAFTFPAPLVEVSRNTFVLELFHGPTSAFKDFGARFMARLFRHFLGATSTPLTVLVATSGDTGSAVANAFFDSSPHAAIRVSILFPKGKVSLVQEKQMTTLGHNVTAYEVDGTFDDCQALVKKALADEEVTTAKKLTSANSINIARLLPQMFYYISAALSLRGASKPIFSVPSGNLGNLTGGIMAHLMGIEAEHFIAACNVNAPFPGYLATGHYSPHPSVETLSNAMDVGNPSNYARILALYQEQLSRIRTHISGARISDAETTETIARTYHHTGYILDPHTAVGLLALDRYRESSRSTAPGIVLATAHPAKFGNTVEQAIGTPPPIPPQLAEALGRESKKVPLGNSYSELRGHLLEA